MISREIIDIREMRSLVSRGAAGQARRGTRAVRYPNIPILIWRLRIFSYEIARRVVERETIRENLYDLTKEKEERS